MKNTYIDLKLEDGSVIQLTLNFSRLLQLKNKRKTIYEKYTTALSGKGDAFENSLVTLYAAYLCANIEKLDSEEIVSFDEFIDAIPQSFILINNLVDQLINPKKK